MENGNAIEIVDDRGVPVRFGQVPEPVYLLPSQWDALKNKLEQDVVKFCEQAFRHPEAHTLEEASEMFVLNAIIDKIEKTRGETA